MNAKTSTAFVGALGASADPARKSAPASNASLGAVQLGAGPKRLALCAVDVVPGTPRPSERSMGSDPNEGTAPDGALENANKPLDAVLSLALETPRVLSVARSSALEALENANKPLGAVLSLALEMPRVLSVVRSYALEARVPKLPMPLPTLLERTGAGEPNPVSEEALPALPSRKEKVMIRVLEDEG